MTGGEVIRRARARAGLTRRELAELLASPEGRLAGWEDGLDEPTFAEVQEAVRATGAEVATVLGEPDLDPHDAALLDTTLSLSVDDRLRRVIAHVRFVQAGREALRAAR